MVKAAIRLFPIFEKAVEEKRLRGFPASPGVAEGRAVVITCLEDFHKIKPDTVLVCPHMSRNMIIVFSEVKGIVTDFGSALANAAIVARECGIPAVVGTTNATQAIEDGDIIRLDGTVGRVEIISSTQ